MRWTPKPKLVYGSVRRSTPFAWWPTRMDDSTVVWLERYIQWCKLQHCKDHGLAWVLTGRQVM